MERVDHLNGLDNEDITQRLGILNLKGYLGFILVSELTKDPIFNHQTANRIAVCVLPPFGGLIFCLKTDHKNICLAY